MSKIKKSLIIYHTNQNILVIIKTEFIKLIVIIAILRNQKNQ